MEDLLASVLVTRRPRGLQILSCPDLVSFDFSPAKFYVGFRKGEQMLRLLGIRARYLTTEDSSNNRE
uniref:Transcriptional regulator n=1 Tax=Angiostrongylus cantonensis TaxID=6313 RepID=A0A0K0DJR8_ANGCA